MNVSSIIQALVIFDECETREQVTAELERLLKSYRFDFYGVLRQPKPSEDPMGLVLAGRWPEGWPEVYIAKKYVLIDPTIRYLGTSRSGFRWRDTIAAFRGDPYRKRMERMMIDARSFALEDGYIFPVHGRSGLLGNMTVGGRVVDLSPVEMAMFDAVAKKVFWRFVELDGHAEALNRAASVDTMLTKREMEVLSHLADGMTSNEISKILKISNHTVDWYMNGIQDKLKAKNRQHVVALAFRLGLVS
ncbi:LuxR family transcriptional regulator [Rhizobiaceae bacterium n13]|uniref:LuxR family transcriptional regulator n=1 Tax=Ferirhizobium litorale TaxID=2927786 RepID=A0AAE3U1H9_9HYPH|nr:LuxR family transcriptional regulator [Fererhizobium litorale]MDI7864836.1 LuxR family transcriptional regulator [Fererhizobium litorale]MDI7923154.1 LuxR family transcriptional regulator [Fererhizobium litorale]